MPTLVAEFDVTQVERGLTRIRSAFNGLESEARQTGRVIDQSVGNTRGFDRAAQGTGRLRTAVTGLNPVVGTLRASLAGLVAGFSFDAVIGELRGFDQSMQTVRGITQATEQEFNTLRQAALDLGRETRFSSTEAAQGIEFLGRAGLDTASILDVLPTTLNLAAAAGVGLADSADVLTNVMSAFNAETSQTSQFADVMSAAVNNANTNFSQLSIALRQVAPIAAATGASIEETSAAIGVLGNNAIQGEQAGTALRAIIASLIDPSTNARTAIQGLGLTLEEVNPERVGIVGAFEALASAEASTADVTRIFGREAAAAAVVLRDNTGAVRDLEGVLQTAEGTTQRLAETMDDSLNGSLLRAQSAFSGLIQSLGQAGLVDVLRDAFDNASDSINRLTDDISASNTVAAPFFDFIGREAVQLLDSLTGGIFNLESNLDSLDAIFAGAFASISDAILSVADVAFPLFQNAVETVGSVVANLADGALNLLSSAFESVRVAISDLVDGGLSLLSGAFNEVASVVGNVADAILPGFTDEVVSGFNAVLDFGTSLRDSGNEMLFFNDSTDLASAALAEQAGIIAEQQLATDQLNTSVGNYSDAVLNMAGALAIANTEQGLLTGGAGDYRVAVEAAEQGTRDQSVAVRDAAVAAREAAAAQREAERVARELEGQGRRLTETFVFLSSNTRDSAAAANEADEAWRRSVVALDDVARATREGIEVTNAFASGASEAFGVSEQAVRSFADNATQLLNGLGITSAQTFEQLATTIQQTFGISTESVNGFFDVAGDALDIFGLELEDVFGRRAAEVFEQFAGLSDTTIDLVLTGGQRLLEFFGVQFPVSAQTAGIATQQMGTTSNQALGTVSASVQTLVNDFLIFDAGVVQSGTQMSTFGQLGTTIVNTLSGLWTQFTGLSTQQFTGFVTTITGLFTGFSGSSTGIIGTLGNLWNQFTGNSTNQFGGFINTALGLFNNFSGSSSGIINALGGLWGQFTGASTNSFSSFTSAATSLFGNFGNFFSGRIGQLGGQLAGFFNQANSGANGLASTLSRLGGLASNVFGGISRGINGLLSQLGAGSAAITNFGAGIVGGAANFGFARSSNPNIQQGAQLGGAVGSLLGPFGGAAGTIIGGIGAGAIDSITGGGGRAGTSFTNVIRQRNLEPRTGETPESFLQRVASASGKDRDEFFGQAGAARNRAFLDGSFSNSDLKLLNNAILEDKNSEVLFNSRGRPQRLSKELQDRIDRSINQARSNRDRVRLPRDEIDDALGFQFGGVFGRGGSVLNDETLLGSAGNITPTSRLAIGGEGRRPEGILPLAKTSEGLGVNAVGAGTGQTVNNTRVIVIRDVTRQEIDDLLDEIDQIDASIEERSGAIASSILQGIA